MTKKKAQEIKTPQYRVQVTKVYAPTEWGKGEWTQVNKKPVYTGKPIDKVIGYQICIAAVDGESSFMVQPWPFGFESQKMFDTPEKAWKHFEDHGSHLRVGMIFNPFSNSYPEGVIVE